MNKEIGAKKSWNGAYTVDCSKVDSLPDITFTFSGKNFSLPATDYIMNTQGTCISSFQGIDIPPPLGTTTVVITNRRPNLDYWRYFPQEILFHL